MKAAQRAKLINLVESGYQVRAAALRVGVTMAQVRAAGPKLEEALVEAEKTGTALLVALATEKALAGDHTLLKTVLDRRGDGLLETMLGRLSDAGMVAMASRLDQATRARLSAALGDVGQRAAMAPLAAFMEYCAAADEAEALTPGPLPPNDFTEAAFQPRQAATGARSATITPADAAAAPGAPPGGAGAPFVPAPGHYTSPAEQEQLLARWRKLDQRIKAGDRGEDTRLEWDDIGQRWLTGEELRKAEEAADAELQAILEDEGARRLTNEEAHALAEAALQEDARP